MPREWAVELKKKLPQARLDEPLARYTTFRIGGPADAYVELGCRAELRLLLECCRRYGAALTVLGFGSNLLVRDRGVRGVVARLRGEFESVEFLPDRRARCGAGVRMPRLVTLCAERGLGGLEPLVGVPGTLGGALVMNAGTREGEIGALVEEVEALDPARASELRLAGSELSFGYRSSNLAGLVVTAGLLRLKAAGKADIMDRVSRLQQRRSRTQPIHTFNVGSTFKNPPGQFAARLIEQAGLKGASVGGARLSPLHANFIENFGAASAKDVLALVDRVRAAVLRDSGVALELEMKVIGE
ncbi:MAG: UDP-N-acetylmuramate dehydrogenase [Elusimicrobia bacterium]|nr:UDP-N-acetylmuramate dehydrogenase [Elusimicrobiota bacterium]MDE2236537.1 UDP-N-acetylmuramate dehydrogenase [Elusimicrobiota bacterium]MDE2425827.1 UDP-N-acetylmuramate dehydrogenase [Elusimicrobiota bacterium]